MDNLGINASQPPQNYNGEVAKALQDILVFFQPGDLEYLRVDLWHWLKAVTGESHSFSVESHQRLFPCISSCPK
jgi:hypothetical protein